ncbi:YqjD family protein [Nitrosomonas sp.]|uniref:DUF883 family protein n=1 Tax=Nitrosomonas sp. TaxID=42353 RepID=UPI00374D1E61
MKNVDTVVDTVSDFAQETVDKATNATYHVANKIVDKGDELNALAHEAIDKATNATNQVADKIGEKGVQLKHAEQRLTKECSIYIRDNPLTSVGIAMGVGFILSKLLSNR